MTTRIIRTDAEIDGLARFLRARKLPVTVRITAGADRTDAQNKLAFDWFRQISEQMGDRTISDVRGHCKLEHGVRMLHAENDDFREQWDRLIRDRFTYAEKLELMLPPTDYPVSRLMKVRQMTRWLDAIYGEFSAQGVFLTLPGPDYEESRK